MLPTSLKHLITMNHLKRGKLTPENEILSQNMFEKCQLNITEYLNNVFDVMDEGKDRWMSFGKSFFFC